MTNRQPAEGFPPADYIHEFMEGRCWTQKRLASELGYSRSFVSDLLSGKRGVSQGLAKDLARVFGSSAILWVGLEQAYQEWRKRGEAQHGRIAALEGENERLKAALKQGQREPDGRLVFQVAIQGLPAMDASPLEVARSLCGQYFGPALWPHFGLLCSVRPEQDSVHRAALAPEGPTCCSENPGANAGCCPDRLSRS